MRYKWSPLNIVCIFLTCVAIYLLVARTSSRDIMGGAYMIPVIIVGFFIDLAAQQLIKDRKWLIAMEIVFIVAVAVINQMP